MISRFLGWDRFFKNTASFWRHHDTPTHFRRPVDRCRSSGLSLGAKLPQQNHQPDRALPGGWPFGLLRAQSAARCRGQAGSDHDHREHRRCRWRDRHGQTGQCPRRRLHPECRQPHGTGAGPLGHPGCEVQVRGLQAGGPIHHHQHDPDGAQFTEHQDRGRIAGLRPQTPRKAPVLWQRGPRLAVPPDWREVLASDQAADAACALQRHRTIDHRSDGWADRHGLPAPGRLDPANHPRRQDPGPGCDRQSTTCLVQAIPAHGRHERPGSDGL